MKPAERIALIERIARGLAWRGLSDAKREAHKRQATEIADELLTGYEQTSRIGWVFVTSDEAEPIE